MITETAAKPTVLKSTGSPDPWGAVERFQQSGKLHVFSGQELNKCV